MNPSSGPFGETYSSEPLHGTSQGTPNYVQTLIQQHLPLSSVSNLKPQRPARTPAKTWVSLTTCLRMSSRPSDVGFFFFLNWMYPIENFLLKVELYVLGDRSSISNIKDLVPYLAPHPSRRPMVINLWTELVLHVKFKLMDHPLEPTRSHTVIQQCLETTRSHTLMHPLGCWSLETWTCQRSISRPANLNDHLWNWCLMNRNVWLRVLLRPVDVWPLEPLNGSLASQIGLPLPLAHSSVRIRWRPLTKLSPACSRHHLNPLGSWAPMSLVGWCNDLNLTMILNSRTST